MMQRRSSARRWPAIRAARTAGARARYRDTVTRPLTDLPVAGYPLVLRVADSATFTHYRPRSLLPSGLLHSLVNAL